MARSDTLVKLTGSLGIPYDELLDGLLWTPSIRMAGVMAIEPFADDGAATAAQSSMRGADERVATASR